MDCKMCCSSLQPLMYCRMFITYTRHLIPAKHWLWYPPQLVLGGRTATEFCNWTLLANLEIQISYWYSWKRQIYSSKYHYFLKVEALVCFLRMVSVISSLSDWGVQWLPLPGKGLPKLFYLKGFRQRGQFIEVTGRDRGRHIQVFQQWSTALSMLFSGTSCCNVTSGHYKKISGAALG